MSAVPSGAGVLPSCCRAEATRKPLMSRMETRNVAVLPPFLRLAGEGSYPYAIPTNGVAA